jgi:ABC-type multidrug transport system ATPase subunit
VGFVPQDDIVLPDLTVRENILHSARIRIGNTLNDQEIQQFVDSLISNVGLAKVRHSLVGDVSKRGISGGERKRVNVALELAAAPGVLFLDEPTSGLDATTALSLIELLRSLSQQGVTIICVVHQPRKEIFTALDDLLLLEAGKQVFFGRAQDAIHQLKGAEESCEDSNPADVILDIISGSKGFSLVQPRLENASDEQICKSITFVEEHGTGADRNLDILLLATKKQKALWHRQVYLTFLRGTRQQSRRYTSFILEILSGTTIGLLIGLSNYEFNGHIFQGLYLSPFEALSSATSYRLVSEQGMLCSLAMSRSGSIILDICY